MASLLLVARPAVPRRLPAGRWQLGASGAAALGCLPSSGRPARSCRSWRLHWAPPPGAHPPPGAVALPSALALLHNPVHRQQRPALPLLQNVGHSSRPTFSSQPVCARSPSQSAIGMNPSSKHCSKRQLHTVCPPSPTSTMAWWRAAKRPHKTESPPPMPVHRHRDSARPPGCFPFPPGRCNLILSPSLATRAPAADHPPAPTPPAQSPTARIHSSPLLQKRLEFGCPCVLLRQRSPVSPPGISGDLVWKNGGVLGELLAMGVASCRVSLLLASTIVSCATLCSGPIRCCPNSWMRASENGKKASSRDSTKRKNLLCRFVLFVRTLTKKFYIKAEKREQQQPCALPLPLPRTHYRSPPHYRSPCTVTPVRGSTHALWCWRPPAL